MPNPFGRQSESEKKEREALERKFNPYHDRSGRFASGGGGGGGGAGALASSYASDDKIMSGMKAAHSGPPVTATALADKWLKHDDTKFNLHSHIMSQKVGKGPDNGHTVSSQMSRTHARRTGMEMTEKWSPEHLALHREVFGVLRQRAITVAPKTGLTR